MKDMAVACSCGSGLNAARCCSFDPGTHTVVAEDDERLMVESQDAAEALWVGDRTVAERLSLGVLELQPRRPVALATLAELRFDEGKTEAASALLKRLIELEPANVWPVNKLAMLELGRGNAGEAETHARHAVRLAPGNAQSHIFCGPAEAARWRYRCDDKQE